MFVNEHDLEAIERAKQDMDEMTHVIALADLRKAVPLWAVPLELWRMIVLPNMYNKNVFARYHGVGTPVPNMAAPKFYDLLFDLLCMIRRARTLPANWNLAMAVFLDKRNGKQGCAALRLVAL